MPRDHFHKSFEEEQRRERKRGRRRRRKEVAQKASRREQHHPGTFPIIVERTRASPSSRHRSRKHYSPEPSSSHSGYESAEYSEGEEFYSIGCLNREPAAYSTRTKLPAPKPVAEPSYQKKRSRKKKKGIKMDEDHTHPLYPGYLERPPSRNGINFPMDSSQYRSVDPIPARKSMESMPGFCDIPDIRCIKRPKKLPPIDKENKGHTDEFPFMKRY